MNKLINKEIGVVYNVEKVKLNKLPRHFTDEDRENKVMKINGKDVKVMINRDRTQYVAFSLNEPKPDNPKFVQHYYVRDHSFFDKSNAVETYVKPVPVDTKKVVEQPETETATAKK